MSRAALALFLVVGLSWGAAMPGLAAPDDAPRIYRWVDADGIAHYTTDLERVPASIRGRVADPPAAESTATGTTPVRHAADVWAEQDRPPDATELEGLENDFGFEDPARAARVAEIDEQIESLLAEIRTDEETLKERVVGPGADPLASADDEEMRAAAARLPGLLASLRTLREERAALEGRSEEP